MPLVPAAALKDYVSKDLGHSERLTIDQERVDQFIEYTGDYQLIHVDPKKTAKTPFGGTIACGFLFLLLILRLMEGLLMPPEGLRMAVSYGLDTVRFIQPMWVGSRVRPDLTLLDVNEKNPGQWLIKACATLEIEGQEKPAYVAETPSLCLVWVRPSERCRSLDGQVLLHPSPPFQEPPLAGAL